MSLFDYNQILEDAKELNVYLSENVSSFNDQAGSWTAELLVTFENLQLTAEKFQKQLENIFIQHETTERNALLKEVLKRKTEKGSKNF